MFERYRDLFEYCPPRAWPWLWLQLAYLLACKALDGRERLLMVMPNGRVHVIGLGDDPNARKAWTPADLAPLLPGRSLAEAVDPAFASDPRRRSILPHPSPPQNGEGTLRDTMKLQGSTGSEPPSPFWGGSGWGLFTSAIGGQGPPS
ncbi:MAG: hypothetical protein QNI84_06100 [Henriciella sp.]|nr:hypothetical protein [Henriciella sp.]